MHALAAVITGKGTGAIATIQICGKSAKGVLEKIFKPAVELKAGKIHVGTIVDNNKTIDQVTIGCIDDDTFAINCHGNPLIVEQICQLLQCEGTELVTAEQLLARISAGGNTIALEAKLTLPKVKTIEGTQLILNQIKAGLSAVTKKWLISVQRSPTTFPYGKNDVGATQDFAADSGQKELNAELYKLLADQAREIIEASQTAKLIIFGSRMVLAGPPNTGKSTLLNRLAGREKAIVTNIKGTTRDWVSAECRIGELVVELIDTAGFDKNFEDGINKASQTAASEMINQADLILLVLDNSESNQQISNDLVKNLSGKKIISVINKTDLPPLLDTTKLPGNLVSNIVKISAISGAGIDILADKVCEITGVKNFDSHQPVCITGRQEQLLKQLTAAKSKETAHSLITELLSGPLNV